MRAALLLLGLALIAVGIWGGDLEVVRETSTYRDFDVESRQSGVQYLSPGLPDRAHEGRYRFDQGVHATPLIALGIVFVLFFLLRNAGSIDNRLGLKWRGITQWAAFVGARAGVLRVAGAVPVARCAAGVFPFLNCQACEMASGACPVGQVQNSILNRRFPAVAVGAVIVAAVFLGRSICGWLCPFGLFSDIVDRISLRRFKPRRIWYAGGLVVLGLLVAGTLAFVAAGIDSQAPFCSTICASGKVYGLLPYYSTTAAGDVAAIGGSPGLPTFLFHGALLLLFFVAAILISGRVWCRYLCPLGAALGLANGISVVKVAHREEACNLCERCVAHCPMGIDLSEEDWLTQSACIRCGRCVAVCERGAREWEFPWSEKKEQGRVEAPNETIPAL